MNLRLLRKAFLSALGVLTYIGALVWVISHGQQWFDDKPESWLGPVLALIVFIVSACTTGSLVLLRPILMYIEGQKGEAVTLFTYTVASLAGIGMVIGGYLIAR
jgi:hypothetical protein